MQIFRKYFLIILLSIMLLIVWGGIEILSDKVFSSLNPNAESYTKPLKPTFDEEVLDTMSERIRSSFPVLPSVFFELNPD